MIVNAEAEEAETQNEQATASGGTVYSSNTKNTYSGGSTTANVNTNTTTNTQTNNNTQTNVNNNKPNSNTNTGNTNTGNTGGSNTNTGGGNNPLLLNRKHQHSLKRLYNLNQLFMLLSMNKNM